MTGLPVTRAAASDTVVDLVSGDTAVLTVPASVTVTAGSNEATIALTGVAPGTTTVSASLDGGTPALAQVEVLADDATATPVAIDPASTTLVINRTANFTVTFDRPTPVAGTTLDIVVDGGIGTAPTTLDVAGNATSATFAFSSGAASASGSLTVSLAGGGGAQTASISVVELAPLGLVLNEVDYNNASTDTAEYIEIFNGDAAPVDVNGFDLVLVNGNNNTDYKTITLTGTIPALGYAVIGPQAVLDATPATTGSPAGPTLKVLLAGQDQIQNGDPDGIALFDASEGLVDSIAYGCPATAPATGMCSTGGLLLRDATCFAGDDTTAVLDATSGAAALCRDPTNGAWVLCPTATPGIANNVGP